MAYVGLVVLIRQVKKVIFVRKKDHVILFVECKEAKELKILLY